MFDCREVIVFIRRSKQQVGALNDFKNKEKRQNAGIDLITGVSLNTNGFIRH